MAQAAPMGPPLSPRETRRSGRRSVPSASASTSKSPDSDLPPRQKDNPQRYSTSSNNGNSRHKRLKQEDLDNGLDERRQTSTPLNGSGGSIHGVANGKAKRKYKDKEKRHVSRNATDDLVNDTNEDQGEDDAEDEEQGITRCICGSTGEDDPDAGEFMVQCETCKVWQHGLCMGYQSEDQVHDDDYYCEKCRPELHAELLKKTSKKSRHSSAANHTSVPPPSRTSRSHSPSHLFKQPSKRRNTMNSRDAAFDESLKEIMAATAAEAATLHDPESFTSVDHRPESEAAEVEVEINTASRKKRKRVEDSTAVKKRTRSASMSSDRQEPIVARDDTPVTAQSKASSHVASAPQKSGGRNKRGARKALVVDTVIPLVEGEEGNATKRSGNGGRTKNSSTVKRPPLSHPTSQSGANLSHEHGQRRSQPNNAHGQLSGPNAAEPTRTYRNSHAYAVSHQPVFTSWNLPDYLSHLEEMLPTITPVPLVVRIGTAGASTSREAVESTMERGVKVKWPSKRMSVGDMNKRVRALVEWVGREQAVTLDRERRRLALERALENETMQVSTTSGDAGDPSGASTDKLRHEGSLMVVDSDTTDLKSARDSPVRHSPMRHEPLSHTNTSSEQGGEKSTMKMMEELMEELIGFQERFGHSARSRERDRRVTVY